jgi:protein tyrosine phosphatase (PTP) superfamily phosphohydrolase (DUF442 family)
MAAAPEPTSRSARAAARDPVADDETDPLDRLPPLDLPGEVTGSSVPAPAARPVAPAANTAKQPEAPRESAAASSKALDLTAATVPAPEPAGSASVGPGLARFVAVDLKLAGGSTPSSAGLAWLVEKGYRTVLDLRESSEVPPSFIAEVTKLGLRYVALPIGLGSIDRDHLNRFNFEIAASEARPLFFFDSDGTRAGAFWYIRRITTDRVDQQIARREAEELGLSDKSYWSAVTNFVAENGAPEKSADATAARPNSIAAALPAPTAAEPAATGAVPPSAAAITPADAPAQPLPPQTQSGARPDHSPPVSTVPSDPIAWRPFVAMAITGLSLPLAYWSRTALPTVISGALASLPGPAHRPKSLPGA